MQGLGQNAVLLIYWWRGTLLVACKFQLASVLVARTDLLQSPPGLGNRRDASAPLSSENDGGNSYSHRFREDAGPAARAAEGSAVPEGLPLRNEDTVGMGSPGGV